MSRESNGLQLITVVSRNACIVNSPEFSDVKFIFKNVSGSDPTHPTDDDGQDHSGETIIFGHKLILALASPVFQRMFYMDKQNQQFVTTGGDEVDMDDRGFNAGAFLEFIRFLYTDKIDYKNLNLEQIVGILACADYYDVPYLKKDCANRLEQIMTNENVIRLLETAEMFRERDLVDKALEFIDQNLESVVGSGEIFCIKLEGLFEILKRDSLDINESFVLDLALKWAGKECRRKNRKPTAQNKREVLGKVFFEIRFGLLASDRISDLVSSNLLSARESLDVVLDVYTPGYVTTGNSKRLRLAPEMGFKSKPRIFGLNKKLMEVDEMEEKWMKRNHFDSLKALAMSLAKAQADLIIRGFPPGKTEKELRDEIDRAHSVFDLEVKSLDEDGEDFRVLFKYNSSQYRGSDLFDPAWYMFDNPDSIDILEWEYDDSDSDY